MRSSFNRALSRVEPLPLEPRDRPLQCKLLTAMQALEARWGLRQRPQRSGPALTFRSEVVRCERRVVEGNSGPRLRRNLRAADSVLDLPEEFLNVNI